MTVGRASAAFGNGEAPSKETDALDAVERSLE
jgi:hypothetical protein